MFVRARKAKLKPTLNKKVSVLQSSRSHCNLAIQQIQLILQVEDEVKDIADCRNL